MMRHAALLAIAALTVALFALPADARGAVAQVPARFHGRWDNTLRGCAVRGITATAVMIDEHGWTGYEEGAEVIAALPPVNGAIRFAMRWSAGNDSARQLWSIRLLGGRLYWLITMPGERPIRETMVRCPAG